MSTFRDTNEKFDLKGDPLKLINNNNFKIWFVEDPSDRKKMDYSEKELKFDVRRVGVESTMDKTPGKLLNVPAFMASGISFYLSIPMNFW